MRCSFAFLLFLFSLTSLDCLIPSTAKAQVTPDGTTSTTVEQTDNNFTIEQGDRVGDNLFHSFDEFSVPTGGSAGFNNAADIANIFSRVTGGDISNIDGLLSASGTANLYLINPNGIIFGENARLDIGGSFYGSTADSLLFDADTEFSASNPDAAPLLEVSIPIGLSFRDNPGDIIVRTAIDKNPPIGGIRFDDRAPILGVEVASGENIALLGGNIRLEAGIVRAEGGSVELGGLSAAGTIDIQEDGSFNFPQGAARSDVTITNSTALNSFGRIIRGETSAQNIKIQARNLNIENGNVLARNVEGSTRNITIDATEDIVIADATISNLSTELITSNPSEVTGEINITARNLTAGKESFTDPNFTGFSEIVSDVGAIKIDVSDRISMLGSFVNSEIDVLAEANTGNIQVEAKELSLANGSEIRTTNRGTGDSGDINLVADVTNINDSDVSAEINETIDILGILPDAIGNNSGGDITISSKSLSIINGADVSTRFDASGDGNAGNISIQATENVLVDGLTTLESNTGSFAIKTGSGNAGNIEIDTPQLKVSNDAFISAATFNFGNAGDVTINASELVEVTSGGVIANEVTLESLGNGGNLTIETARLIVSEGGFIFTPTRGTGKAGDLTIRATDSIVITGSDDLFFSTLSARSENFNGAGGDINIFTSDLTVSDEAIIDVGNFPRSETSFTRPGTGEPGNINIQADSIKIEDGGGITAATRSLIGEGANINLISEAITLDNNALISARAFEEADGGNLSIESGFILAFPDGNNDIVARAEQGNGGQITIDTEAIFGLAERVSEPANFTNDIDASSEFGLQGDFALNTPDFDPTTGLIELPASVSDASDQISQNPCQQGVGSQFVVTGKGGLPPSPASLNSSEIRVGLVDPLSGQGELGTGGLGDEETKGENTATEAVPAMGWVFNDRGEVTLVANSNADIARERFDRQTSSSCSASSQQSDRQ